MEQKKSWFSKLKEGLGKTNDWFKGLFGGERIDDEFYDELEEAMILADMGMETAAKLLDELRGRGADYFILGCTELPILADSLDAPGPFIDPTAELAAAAIGFCGYEVKR